jgi:hypothetical protein
MSTTTAVILDVALTIIGFYLLAGYIVHKTGNHRRHRRNWPRYRQHHRCYHTATTCNPPPRKHSVAWLRFAGV